LEDNADEQVSTA
jgi:hypothetical protein